jgi:P4 family phage/plasmid primase-like protien
MTAKREELENLFEFKQHRVYVTGPASIHPKTGGPYAVEWRRIPAMPDVLLNRLCELVGTPKATAAETLSDDVKHATDTLDRFLEFHDVATTGDWFNKGKQWYRPIECPWSGRHTNDSGASSSCIGYLDGGGYSYDCKHSCNKSGGDGWKDLRRELEARTGKSFFTTEKAIIGGSLPVISHATLADAFLRDNRDFAAVYDLEHRPTAQWAGTRWDIKKDDTLLWKAIAEYLKGLFPKYKAPEKGPDPRMRLYDATFTGNVVRAVKPFLTPVRSTTFDRDPYLLGLPECRVIDLHTGATREMRREDYITRRIYHPVDPNMGTPLFDKFMDEITVGDASLRNYLLRLGALCLTAKSHRGLFFFYGKGTNGKSKFIEILTNILGADNDGFALALRPDQVTVSRFGDDAAKRTLADFEGKRLVTVNESVGGNLNVALLKLMSGEDVLSGARMRQDARQFKPTHKVILPTNDRPHLPADDAFRGRVHMIPFNANFVGREDRDIGRKLAAEYPGILYRLLTLCPDVLENGLRPPASVIGETDTLFSELDLTKQFADDCLIDGGETTSVEMEQAIVKWLREQSQWSDSAVETIMRELKQRPGVKYVRARRSDDSKQGTGRGRVWTFVGVSVHVSN